MTSLALNHATAKAAACAAIARLNQAHVQFWCEHSEYDSAPYDKLLNKVLAFLRGELKSEANLQRFHEAFADWRESLPQADNLAFRIAENSCAALYAATETLFDDQCDDLTLVVADIDALYQEFAELGGDSEGLGAYWQSLQQELSQLLGDCRQRPLAKDYFQWLSQQDVSLFGLG